MSEIALYDTLRKIPEVSDEEAKQAVADIANSREVATKADIKDMATKADIAELKAETKADIAELKTETKADIAELKAEMYRVNNRTIMWIVGVGVAVAGVVVAVVG